MGNTFCKNPRTDPESELQIRGDDSDLDVQVPSSSVGTAAYAKKKWFWGHADSFVQPPPGIPALVSAMAVPLKLSTNPQYYQDMAQFAVCPHFLDRKAKDHGGSSGCPFLGGTAYVRHKDVKDRLGTLVEELAKGTATRQNELGYFVLSGAAFPGVERVADGQKTRALENTMGLGASLEEHRIQRRWLEQLLTPKKFPSRNDWVAEVRRFLATKEQKEEGLKVKYDVSRWWQQALWKHLFGRELTDAEADELADFQIAWLQSANLPFPNKFLDHLGDWAETEKLWKLESIIEAQQKWRGEIVKALPAEVPAGDRELVAQGALEMTIFAGGLSVPQTIHAALCALFVPELFPSSQVNESNVEAFVYEVTRLFPAVQGFCYWKDGQRQCLSLNAALRDPAVWGSEDAHKFTLKDLKLYESEHVGFASFAKANTGAGHVQFDSRACPGQHLALSVIQAWVLAFSTWGPAAEGGVRRYWSPEASPKGAKVPTWWKSIRLMQQDWLDGDQTGEDVLADQSPVEVSLVLYAGTKSSKSILQHLNLVGRSLSDSASHRLSLMGMDTMTFYEVSKRRFKHLSERADAQLIDRSPAGPFHDYYDLQFGYAGGDIRLPIPSSLTQVAKQHVINFYYQVLKKTVMVDDVDEELVVRTQEDRREAIVLCQQLFQRKGGEESPPNSLARPDSYLPKPKYPFSDITTDALQVGIARCGIGQLLLKENRDPRLKSYGDIACDASVLSTFEHRHPYEKLGATAVFKRSGKRWDITAIDWKHGGKIVKPGDQDWEHAKWVWRCSVGTYTTAVFHLAQNHWIQASGFSTSIRENLGPDHPIRRVLAVHAYNTPLVNYDSALTLYPEFSALHRMSPFPLKSIWAIFKAAADSFKYQTWPEYFKTMDLQAEEKERLPMFEDGLQIWKVLNSFYKSYVELHYKSDADVLADVELCNYWKFTSTPPLAKAVPPLSKAALEDHLTQAVFDVTVYHEFVGGVVNYTTDPAGMAMQVRKGLDMADLRQHTNLNSLVASTGTPMPMLMPSNQEGDKDWLHLLLLGKGAEQRDKEVEKLYHQLMKDLRQVAVDVKRRDESGEREHGFGKMNPLMAERSVSL